MYGKITMLCDTGKGVRNRFLKYQIANRKSKIEKCPGQESNLHRGNPYQPLKLARLPVPPPGRAIRFIIYYL